MVSQRFRNWTVSGNITVLAAELRCSLFRLYRFFIDAEAYEVYTVCNSAGTLGCEFTLTISTNFEY
jgi:hypothetical protein